MRNGFGATTKRKQPKMNPATRLRNCERVAMKLNVVSRTAMLPMRKRATSLIPRVNARRLRKNTKRRVFTQTRIRRAAGDLVMASQDTASFGQQNLRLAQAVKSAARSTALSGILTKP